MCATTCTGNSISVKEDNLALLLHDKYKMDITVE